MSSALSNLAHQVSLPRGWLDGRISRARDVHRDAVVKVTILLTSGLILLMAWLHEPGRRAVELLWHTMPGRAMIVVGGVYGFFATVWCFWRLWLAIRYRPSPVVGEDRCPSITVVVPAFNEGPLVGETLRCLAEADYPHDRLKIIVVDDGSTDDTWSHVKAAAEEIGPIVMPIRCPVNRGKRWALWEGFRRGEGEIFVTVDSDSLVERGALRAMVSPMVLDPTIGAVAGNVRVLNHHGGLIPRMMAVRYVMTFDYKRTAQSMMGGGAVLCCAGALAAYRRSAVMPVLDRWLHQVFCGCPARAGEDHAMTNFILGLGYKVSYQRTARVHTKTPTTYVGLCKMFLRWGRSNVRETVHTARYVFTDFRKERKLGIRFNFLMGALGLIMPYPFLVSGLILAVFLPTVFGLKMLAACVSGSLFTVLFCLARERSSEAIFGTPYAFFSTFLLWWIWPYALLTCHKSVWLTRSVD
ncbi:MAG: glycosyltransferase [Phycisphaerae bacterium]|nr:glycosyltransferase [Phycisphaerae bacterium]